MNETPPRAAGGPGIERSRSVRALLRLNLSVVGAGFAWFAYIDAPITDAAMRVFAAAVLVGLLSMVASLICAESKTERGCARWWRVALWSFALTTALMLTAATVTLNLKGSGNEESDTQTSVVMHV